MRLPLAVLLTGAIVPASAQAVVPSRTICVRFSNIKVCRTPHATYDRICTTVYFGDISSTRCRRRYHH